MKILVTGASGRIGQAISLRLTAQRHTVVGLDRRPSPLVQHQPDLGQLHLPANAAALASALRGVDAVVHSAALHAPDVGVASDAEYERSNVIGTQQLWRQAVQAGVRRFVFTSTTALYGAAASALGRAAWLTEASLPQPRTVYHRSKLAAEAWLRDAATQPGAPVLRILRVSRCFAEAAPPMAVYRLHRGIAAADVAIAHELALTDGGAAVELFIVSAPTPFEPADAAALFDDAPSVLARRAPQLVAWFARRGWPLPARIDRVYDASKAAHQLGWVAQQGPEAVLRQLDSGSADVLPASG